MAGVFVLVSALLLAASELLLKVIETLRDSWRTYRERQSRYRDLRELEAMEDHVLRDAGISRFDIRAAKHCRSGDVGPREPAA